MMDGKARFHRQRNGLVHYRMVLALVGLLLSLTPGCTTAAVGQAAQKVVEGKVVGSDAKPQAGAIVYLRDSKSNAIKSFISTADGSYRFGQLSPEIDYEIWAEYQGRKSATKTVSSFDSKKLLSYVLKVDTGK